MIQIKLESAIQFAGIRTSNKIWLNLFDEIHFDPAKYNEDVAVGLVGNTFYLSYDDGVNWEKEDNSTCSTAVANAPDRRFTLVPGSVNRTVENDIMFLKLYGGENPTNQKPVSARTLVSFDNGEICAKSGLGEGVWDIKSSHHGEIVTASRNGIIKRSIDHAKTWEMAKFANGTPKSNGTFDIAFDPTNSENVYAINGSNNLWYSQDGAKTWNFVTYGNVSFNNQLIIIKEGKGLIFKGTIIAGDPIPKYYALSGDLTQKQQILPVKFDSDQPLVTDKDPFTEFEAITQDNKEAIFSRLPTGSNFLHNRDYIATLY